jgi:peptide/nickel transport system permease protein
MTVILTNDARAAEPPRQSVWARRGGRFFRQKPAVVALVFLVLIVAFCFSAGIYTKAMGIDPNATNLLRRFQAPSSLHWLGTDELGRDVLARLMYGGQVSIAVGVVATLLTALIGVTIGVTAGYARGRSDAFLMRFTDCVLALPLVPLLIVLGAVDLTKLGLSAEQATSPLVTFLRIVIIIALVDWTTIARISRAGTLSVRDQDYMRAARVSGGKGLYNILVHVLPNVATPIIVAATLTVGRVILFESTLSFLGFGISPPTPSWGNMLTNAQQLMSSAPSLALYPGLLIFLTVISVNFVGDGLRRAVDPRSER